MMRESERLAALFGVDWACKDFCAFLFFGKIVLNWPEVRGMGVWLLRINDYAVRIVKEDYN